MLHPGTRAEYHEKKGKKIFGKEDCPFCDIKKQEDIIIWRGKYWYILHNIYPYSGDMRHVMAVPYAHKEFSYQLDMDEFEELREVHIFLKDWYGEQSYFSCTRETMANRSVEHAHMHFIPGKLQGKFLRKMLELQGFPVQEPLTLS